MLSSNRHPCKFSALPMSDSNLLTARFIDTFPPVPGCKDVRLKFRFNFGVSRSVQGLPPNYVVARYSSSSQGERARPGLVLFREALWT